MTQTAAIGSVEWFEAKSAQGGNYHGERHVIDIVIGGDRSGGGLTYHVVLEDGSAPQFRDGPSPEGADASLEMSRSEAEAHERGEVAPVVSFMRGSAKTKGATRPLYELFRLL